MTRLKIVLTTATVVVVVETGNTHCEA